MTFDELNLFVNLYSRGRSVVEIARIVSEKYKTHRTRSSFRDYISNYDLKVGELQENIDKLNKGMFNNSCLSKDELTKLRNFLDYTKHRTIEKGLKKFNIHTKATHTQIKYMLALNATKLFYVLTDLPDANYVDNQKAIESLDKSNLLKEINKLKKELLTVQLNKETILDTIKQSIASVKPSKVLNIKINNKLKEEVVCLDISDVHIGEKVTLNETAGHEEYNFEIFKQRIDRLTEGIIKCINIQRKGSNIRNLHINMLGDICTGECIFRGQQKQIDLPLHDQIFKGADVLVNRLILPLCKIFSKVTIRTVGGNHGRLAKPGEYAWNSSSDFFLYKTMELMLQNQKNCKFLISDSQAMVYELEELPGIRHLLIHGHQAKSWNGIPYYAINRLHMRYVDLMSFPIHYIHLGHFHSSGEISNVNGETLFNGAWFATNDFSLNVLSIKSIPKQRLYGMNHRGIVWTRDIMLSEPKVLTISKDKIYTPINNY